MKEDKLPKMRVYEWDEDFYKEIIKDHNFSYGITDNKDNLPQYFQPSLSN